ncbi:TonB-dependent receptor [Pseudomonas phoenicis]|uniref:TonB-dependent receptor n=1 Tax=unclassified Pseudomonas TaxID=196821 RepID=UPI0039A100F4
MARAWLGGVIGAWAVTAGMAHAQGNERVELEDIVVESDKLEQTRDRLPASLSVIDASTLQSAPVDSLEQLVRRTPGFTFQPFGQSGTQLPVVRGLTSNATAFSNSLLMLVDGVPVLRGQGFDNDLVGVERVEILRGPQSALYGRNAEAGVLSVNTRQPGAEDYARVETGFGTRHKQTYSADLSTALVDDTLYAGFAGQFTRQDGYLDDDFAGAKADDRERQSGRLTLRWTPDALTDATLRYSRIKYRDEASQWGSRTGPDRAVNSGLAGRNHSSGDTWSLDVRRALGEDVELRSITARSVFDDRLRQDTDFQPLDLMHLARDYHFETLSQELRLSGSQGQSRWLLGLYADREDHALDYEQKLPFGLNRTQTDLGGNTAAVFGQWLQPLSDAWSLTLGGRYEYARAWIDPAGTASQSDSWRHFTPKVALQYALTDDAQAYLSYTQGMRAGGFNAFASSAGNPAYDPEKVDSYELGIKGLSADQRLRYSAALYRMQVRDMQVQQLIQQGLVYITNAASATSTGLDLDLEYLLGERWTLTAALGLNRTRFDRFSEGANDYRDNRNPFAPDVTGHLGLRYDADAGWYVQGAVSAVGKVYLDAANNYRRPGYGLVDVSGGYRFGQYTVSTYVDNLTNQRYDASGLLNGAVTVYSPPREVGVRVSFEL